MKTLMNKSLALFVLIALAASSSALPGSKVAHAATTWDISGDYVFDMNFEGTDYPHEVSLTQDGSDNLTGNGSSGAYTWVITSGSVVDDTFSFDANYTATPDAVDPQTVLSVEGSIAEDGSMSGTWSDNYNGGERSGTWASQSDVLGTLAAEDFGVVDYDTGLGQLSGYSAGFGLTDANFADAQSVVVKLYAAGDQLLQTNTLIGDVPGNQISSPFDVSGNFDYATDGYWTNVRESEYGQSVPAAKVVATVVLANGKMVTAENTNLSGDPETIYPEASEFVKVTIVKYIDGDSATAESADNNDFLMNASWDAENTGAGSGQFSLSENGFNNPNPYYATTADMTSGADYSVSEVSDSEMVGSACVAEGAPYALGGYTYGNSLAEAAGMELSDEAPAFTNLTSDKYVIVWNDDCATEENAEGEIGGEVVGGEGELAVTSVEVVDGTAVADGTFENGWKYRFNITVPTDENGVAMKFANWDIDGAATDSIPAANNMRISSAQAVSESPVTVTAADTYTIPDLDINEDLNPSVDGLQIQVLVEVKIPAGTTNGSYTTSYGVRSQ